MRFPLDNVIVWACLHTFVEHEKTGAPCSFVSAYPLRLFDFPTRDGPIHVHSDAYGMFNEFVYSQYT